MTKNLKTVITDIANLPRLRPRVRPPPLMIAPTTTVTTHGRKLKPGLRGIAAAFTRSVKERQSRILSKSTPALVWESPTAQERNPPHLSTGIELLLKASHDQSEETVVKHSPGPEPIDKMKAAIALLSLNSRTTSPTHFESTITDSDSSAPSSVSNAITNLVT
ncbi:hypothetical protein HDV02_004912, partial [Globomyces sp. JEL0801]